jgi:hypothetical protein
VSQVGEAVTQMDQVTQQNAALVEEMAAAASSLSHQAQALVGAVAVFKLTADQARAAQPGGGATGAQRPVPAAPAGKPASTGTPVRETSTLRSTATPAPAGKKASAAAAPSAAKSASAPPKLAQPVAAGAEDDWESF